MMRDRLRQLWQKKLVRNTVWMILGHGGRGGMQALYFVLAARTLGVEKFGVFAGALALAKILLPFSGWGSDEVLVRRVSRDSNEFPEAFGNALSILVVSGSLFIGIALGVNQLLLAGKVSPTLILLIASAELLLYRLQFLVRRAFQAYERLNVTAIFKAAPSVVLVIAVLGFRFSSDEHSVETWGWWYLGAMAGPAIVGVGYTLRELGLPHFKPRAALRQLVEGFFFALSESSKTAYSDTDKMLLLRLTTREMAGYYKAAYRVVSVLMIPVLALVDAAHARFFRDGAKGVRQSYRLALRLMPMSALYGGVMAVCLYFGAPLLPIILGPGYEETASVVRWFALIPVIQAVSYLLMQTLMGGGYQPARALAQFGVAILNAGANFFFIPIYGWRASAGIAVASELLLAIVLFAICTWVARHPERRSPRASA